MSARCVDDTATLLTGRPLALDQRLRLATEILATYLQVRRLMRREELREVVRRLRAHAAPKRTGEEALSIGRRLAHPIHRTLDPLPWDSRCLMSSLTLLAMLERRGVSCTLHIGVRSAGGFRAHAWVEREGRALLPRHGYEPLTVL